VCTYVCVCDTWCVASVGRSSVFKHYSNELQCTSPQVWKDVEVMEDPKDEGEAPNAVLTLINLLGTPKRIQKNDKDRNQVFNSTGK